MEHKTNSSRLLSACVCPGGPSFLNLLCFTTVQFLTLQPRDCTTQGLQNAVIHFMLLFLLFLLLPARMWRSHGEALTPKQRAERASRWTLARAALASTADSTAGQHQIFEGLLTHLGTCAHRRPLSHKCHSVPRLMLRWTILSLPPNPVERDDDADGTETKKLLY